MLRPRNENVLIRVQAPPQKTRGGLFLAPTPRGRPDRAEVVRIGPGRLLLNGERVPVAVKPGDTVLFDPYKLRWVEGMTRWVNTPSATGGDLAIIHEDDIRAVLE